MIYTLTLNAAIDLNFTCEAVKSEKINRVQESSYSPNGKAINVSIVLDHFKTDSVAMGVFGGFTGKHIVDCLTDMGIRTCPFFIDEATRINVFVNDEEREFKFVGKGGFVPESTKEEILGNLCQKDDITQLIISGSLPPGIDPEFLNEIMQICVERDIKVVLDMSHPYLAELLSLKPLLIKPNDDELMDVFGLHADSEANVKNALLVLHSLGAQNTLLTLGSKGMYFSDGESIYFCNAPKINLHSSACAGDSALAAFLSVWLKDKSDVVHAMKLASAVGADVAASAGIGQLSMYPLLMDELVVERLI